MFSWSSLPVGAYVRVHVQQCVCVCAGRFSTSSGNGVDSSRLGDCLRLFCPVFFSLRVCRLFDFVCNQCPRAWLPIQATKQADITERFSLSPSLPPSLCMSVGRARVLCGDFPVFASFVFSPRWIHVEVGLPPPLVLSFALLR